MYEIYNVNYMECKILFLVNVYDWMILQTNQIHFRSQGLWKKSGKA